MSCNGPFLLHPQLTCENCSNDNKSEDKTLQKLLGEVKRKANKFVQYEIHEETVITGMIVTTYKDYGLKSFRLRANNDLNSPQLLTVKDPISSVVREYFNLI